MNTTPSEDIFDKPLTCNLLFAGLQHLEPQLIKTRRVFITRNHRSIIQFRILNAAGDTVYFTRTYDWQDHNTLPAIEHAVETAKKDLLASGLIKADS